MKHLKRFNENLEFEDDMQFWHGGDLDNYDDIIAQKNGRYEYGPGLYLTTHYDTAKKYAKGRRKFYMISVEKGNDINKSLLDIDRVKEFVNKYVVKNKQREILQRIEKYNKENTIKGYIFNNILLNEKALSPRNTSKLRQFLIDNGVDYEIVDNPFGWGEKMMVLYNMKKIKNVKQITSKDKIENYDLLKKPLD